MIMQQFERHTPRRLDTPYKLALSLARRLEAMSRNVDHDFSIDVNVGMVANHISGWLRDDGITPGQVDEMIYEFTAGPGWLRPDRDAGVLFLHFRQALINRVVAREKEREKSNFTAEQWLSFADNPVETEEDWLRR